MSKNATTASLDIDLFLQELDENLNAIRAKREAGDFSNLPQEERDVLLEKLEKIEELAEKMKK